MCLAVPGKILSISEDGSLMRAGQVSFGGVVRNVNLAYVPEAKPGQYVIVHAGFALNVLDEAEALEVFEQIREIDRLGRESG